jgi:fumarate reductase flavoprotein subunit
VLEPVLAGHVEAGRVTVLTGAGAVDLILDAQGAVQGVVTEDDEGRRSDVKGRNVALTSGGCAANPVMFENLHGVPLYSKVAYPYSQGTGLSLGLAAGGYLRGGEHYVSSFGSIAADDQVPTSLAGSMEVAPDTRAPWEVFVNARGERFVQEDHPSVGHRERALDRQPGHRFWAVFDQQILDRAPPLLPGWSRERLLAAFNTHPMFRRAPSLSELGVATGIHPAGLVRSVADYNRALAAGQPDALERSHRPEPIARPPFYAMRSQGWTLKSFAGLAVNADLQVITAEGQPIGNLYAAGEVLGGGATGGKAYTAGAMVTSALTFGRLIGQKSIRF